MKVNSVSAVVLVSLAHFLSFVCGAMTCGGLVDVNLNLEEAEPHLSKGHFFYCMDMPWFDYPFISW